MAGGADRSIGVGLRSHNRSNSVTPLDKTIKRALQLGDKDYVITLTPQALKLTVKGHKNGIELPWLQLVSGESALAVALHASVGAFAERTARVEAKKPKSPARKKAKS
jgi:hypothetical protein